MIKLEKIVTACFCLVLLLLLFPSCKSTPEKTGNEKIVPNQENSRVIGCDPRAPSWFVTGRVQRFSRDNFIYGLGYSDPDQSRDAAVEQSRTRAKENIAEQIEVMIDSERTSIIKSLYTGGKFIEQDYFKSVIKEWVKEILVGVRLEDYYDVPTGMAGTVGNMDIRVFSNRMLQKAQEKHDEVMGNLEAFDGSVKQGNISDALKELIRAHGAMEEISRHHGKVIAIGTSEANSKMKLFNESSLKKRLIAELSIVDGVRMEVIEGDEQTAGLSGTLDDTIVVKVTHSNGKPLAGLPMEVSSGISEKTRKPVTLFTGNTGKDGSVSFKLKGLKSTGSHILSVPVLLDLMTFVDKDIALKAPFCSITCYMPTMETSRVDVVIYETIDGAEVRNPHSASKVEELLGDMGFQVVRKPLSVPAREAVRMSPGALAKLVGGKCDYLILGKAEAKFSSEAMGFVFFKSRVLVDALEISTGLVIHFEVPWEATKAGDLPEKRSQAAQESLRIAGEKLMELLSEKFKSRFESGADWAE